MRAHIKSVAVLGICLSFATAPSQQTPAPETKASDPEGSRPKPAKSAPCPRFGVLRPSRARGSHDDL